MECVYRYIVTTNCAFIGTSTSLEDAKAMRDRARQDKFIVADENGSPREISVPVHIFRVTEMVEPTECSGHT